MNQQKLYIKNVAKAIFKPSKNLPYDVFHTMEAQSIEKHLAEKYGELSAATISKCEEYACTVFGEKKFTPWLRVYSLFSGEFKEGWIPDNYYGAVVVPKLKGPYGSMSRLKPLNSAIFKDDFFPDLGSHVNGLFLDTDYNVIPAQEMKDTLFRQHDRVVFKVDDVSQGKGIFFFEKNSFTPEAVKKLGNGVFQYYIEQHPSLHAFAPNSVATLRVTSVIDELGNVSVRACYLRLGVGEDTHVQSASNIRIPIDLTTGALNEDGYLPTWLPIAEHPTSGLRFANEKVPHFDKCIEVVKQSHLKLPFARIIGWDLAVDKNGEVAIMEWNGAHNGIKFSEATQGPCFADLEWHKLRNN